MQTPNHNTEPMTTSAFSDRLDALRAQAEALETMAEAGASALTENPAIHITAMQNDMHVLQDAMAPIEGLENDNDMFGILSSLHGRRVRAGIELCVQWAQKKIDVLLIDICDAQNGSLKIGNEENRQWWHTPRTDDQRLNALIDEAERSYEQAAITVQALNAADNARLMPAIDEMKSRLRSIVLSSVDHPSSALVDAAPQNP